MPLPLFHAVVGYGVYEGAKKETPDWKLAASCMVLANAADLDFIPGILVGRPDLFHHSFTHSFTMAAAVGLGFGAVMKIWKHRTFLRNFLLAFFAYSSHILLDLLFDHTSMPVFWPFTPAGLMKRLAAFDLGKIHFNRFDNFLCDRFLTFHCLKRLSAEMTPLLFASLLIFLYSEFKKRPLSLSLALFSGKE